MEAFFGKFVMSYLLFPVIAFLLGCVVFVIAKKNKLLSNKRLIAYVLLSLLLLSLPALTGFIDYIFIPYIYIVLQLFYLAAGFYHLKAIGHFLPDFQEKPYAIEFTFTLVLAIIGMAFFSLVFNLCSDLQYGLWASTCIVPFVFISLLRKSYQLYLDIPLEIYKIWEGTDERSAPDYSSIDPSELMVVDMEFSRKTTDTVPVHISVKAADSMMFGYWFQRCVNDYNRKYPMNRISYYDPNYPYGWIFYVKPSFFKPRKYIDPELSFEENRIKGGCTIIAKRVRKEEIA